MDENLILKPDNTRVSYTISQPITYHLSNPGSASTKKTIAYPIKIGDRNNKQNAVMSTLKKHNRKIVTSQNEKTLELARVHSKTPAKPVSKQESDNYAKTHGEILEINPVIEYYKKNPYLWDFNIGRPTNITPNNAEFELNNNKNLLLNSVNAGYALTNPISFIGGLTGAYVGEKIGDYYDNPLLGSLIGGFAGGYTGNKFKPTFNSSPITNKLPFNATSVILPSGKKSYISPQLELGVTTEEPIMGLFKLPKGDNIFILENNNPKPYITGYFKKSPEHVDSKNAIVHFGLGNYIWNKTKNGYVPLFEGVEGIANPNDFLYYHRYPILGWIKQNPNAIKTKQFTVDDIVDVNGNINTSNMFLALKEVYKLFDTPGPMHYAKRTNILGETELQSPLRHMYNAAKTAQSAPVPRGSTKQELVFAALVHDIGELFKRKGHAVASYLFIKRLFPNLPENVSHAIKVHMNNGGTKLQDSYLAQSIRVADVGSGLPYETIINKYPYLKYKTGTKKPITYEPTALPVNPVFWYKWLTEGYLPTKVYNFTKNILSTKRSVSDSEINSFNSTFNKFAQKDPGDLYYHCAEFKQFIDGKYPNTKHLGSKVDEFIDRLLKSARGINAPSSQLAKKYATTTLYNRPMSGHDAGQASGGLYTSNSNNLALGFSSKKGGMVAEIELKKPSNYNNMSSSEKMQWYLTAILPRLYRNLEYLQGLYNLGAKAAEGIMSTFDERVILPEYNDYKVHTPVKLNSLITNNQKKSHKAKVHGEAKNPNWYTPRLLTTNDYLTLRKAFENQNWRTANYGLSEKQLEKLAQQIATITYKTGKIAPYAATAYGTYKVVNNE